MKNNNKYETIEIDLMDTDKQDILLRYVESSCCDATNELVQQLITEKIPLQDIALNAIINEQITNTLLSTLRDINETSK